MTLNNTEHPAVPVWNWDEEQTSDGTRGGSPSPGSVATQMAITAVAGAVLHSAARHAELGNVLWCIAIFIGASGLWAPRLYRAWRGATDRVGQVLAGGITWLLVVPVFYGLFTAGRVALLIARRDPMQRKFPCPEQDTFWTPKPEGERCGHYERQY